MKPILIAIEGIDQIGKSTFCVALCEELKKMLNDEQCLNIPIDIESSDKSIFNITRPQIVNIEKPTIGLNTISKNTYPLQDTRSIFAIRNVGLFEELIFQFKKNKLHNLRIAIRDRFTFSELAYGSNLRLEEYDIFGGFDKYLEWNYWMEEQLDSVAHIIPITFYLDEGNPNEDEVVSSSNLSKINKSFLDIHRKSRFENKMLMKINMDKETGLTNILDHIPYVATHIENIL